MRSLLLALFVVPLLACSMSGVRSVPDASPADVTNDTTTPPFSTVIPPHPPPASVPVPPQLACTGDLVDAGGYPAPACPLPRAVCADPYWQAYYDNGTCVAGQCVWVASFYYCGSAGCDSTTGSCYPHQRSTLPDPHH